MIRKQISAEKKVELMAKLDANIQETGRVQTIAQSASVILEAYDEEFSHKTGLTKVDWGFLFVATALQIARQYLLTNFPERKGDQEAAKEVKGGEKEASDRKHRYYNPSLEEIVSNPVPFDANVGSDGALSGGGSLGHRVMTLGHDPLLGLVFGTANIATSTLTTASFQSWHIKTGARKNGGFQDVFGNHADTLKVFSETAAKLTQQGLEGKTKVASSLVKEVVHLKSDIKSKNSLPIPIVAAFDPKLASFLADYGVDMENVLTVGKQAAFSILINQVVAMVHAMFYQGNSEEELHLFQVRTRKILMYSNLIASSSNLAVVAITQDFTKLDVGGLVVTLWRLLSDMEFIQSVREDFIAGRFVEQIKGNNL